MTIARPEPNEYSTHVGTYVSKVTQHDLIEALHDSSQKFIAFIDSLPKEKYLYRYADGKWTIQDIVAHLIDCERIMVYRALTIARNDKTNLPGFEENDYAAESNAGYRSMSVLMEEYKHLRKSTILFFEGLNEQMALRKGIANGNPITVRALGYSISGHETHHMQVMKERYL